VYMCSEMNEAITAKLWNLVDIAHHKYFYNASELRARSQKDEKGKQ